jgi:hypothetical protein
LAILLGGPTVSMMVSPMRQAGKNGGEGDILKC